jgi:hypothetical protein
VAPAVDHVVVNVLEDMDAAVARFRALGFTLTERGYHSLGSINHLMVFGADYLELVGIEPGAQPVRREVADSPIGLNGLVFRTDDAGRLYEQLSARRLPVLPPVDFDRPVEIDGRVERAAFRTVRVDPGWGGGGRIYFCEHRTPELVWRPQWQHHANGASGLAGLTIVTPAPEAEASRLAALLGVDAAPASDDDAAPASDDDVAPESAGEAAPPSAGEASVTLGEVRLAWCTAERYRARFGAFGCSSSRQGEPGEAVRDTYMAALAIRTGSLDRLRACLRRAEASALQWDDAADAVTVAAASAYDCPIEFIEQREEDPADARTLQPR